MKVTAWGALAIGWLILPQAPAAEALLPLRSFGYPETAAAIPAAELIEGTNGLLYGTAAGGGTDQGSVFQLQKDGGGFRVLKRFGQSANEGRRPFAAVLEATDGLLYGTTVTGGQSNFGTVFRLQKDGSAFTNLWHFRGTNGAFPEARLLEGGDGKLYGTTSGGGSNDYGTVFRLNKDGSDFEMLRRFGGTNGANPEAALLLASDGLLYGTTHSGGVSNLGTIFRLAPDGSAFTVLRSFTAAFGTNGHSPLSGLVEATNGPLFGTTSEGGTNGTGTIFSINKDGSGFRVLKSFGGTNGLSPRAGLLLAGDGRLYGTTYAGGESGNGVVFHIGPDGENFTVLTNLTVALASTAALLTGTDGRFYGTSTGGGEWGGGTVFSLATTGDDFTVLTSFHESGGDGASAYAGLTATSEGRLHGVTRLGGEFYSGTVFSIHPRQRDYQLHWSFDGFTGGSRPVASLLEVTSGRLYGTTEFGGSNGAGMVFGIGKDGGQFSALHHFTGGTNGLNPRAGLVQHTNGNLYGSTMLGGATTPGALFRLSPVGSNYTILKRFATADGLDPMQVLTVGRDGQLYGTTPYLSAGTVFRFAPNSGTFTVLKTFTTASQGVNPLSPLLEGSDGKLYGTTYGGGATNNAGTIYRLNTNGTGFQVLSSFTGLGTDGRHPCGLLVEHADGAIYGTTERGGGVHDGGTLFRISKDGSGFQTLASFAPATGIYPKGGVTRGSDGALYGTTDQGGALGFGAIFRYGPVDVISQFEFAGGNMKLHYVGLPGEQYWIEQATNLTGTVTWIPIGVTNAPADGAFAFTATAPSAQETYFRLRR